jgi:hypothetical protein
MIIRSKTVVHRDFQRTNNNAALLHGGHLFSLNGKHFPMPEIAIKKAW